MTSEKEIRSMYREIVEYNGNFGDPIDTPSFDPWEIVRREALTEFERKGVCVSMLCFLTTAIDNATYEDAVAPYSVRHVGPALRDALFGDLPLMRQALEAFTESEAAFFSALGAVYREWVIPEAAT